MTEPITGPAAFPEPEEVSGEGELSGLDEEVGVCAGAPGIDFSEEMEGREEGGCGMGEAALMGEFLTA